jgi:uncharacterized protein involved in type VI secretion and phage assembly
MNKTYYGKYRGEVLANNDEDKRGRLKVKIKGFYNEKDGVLPWALPCVPYAGKGVGLFLIPPIGANVWIEFENGDPSCPIWTGCFWSDPLKDSVDIKIEAPEQKPEMKVLKTDIGTIAINDAQKSITIEAKIEDKQTIKIEMKASEIEIINGAGASIKLEGNTVSINNDGLKVT